MKQTPKRKPRKSARDSGSGEYVSPAYAKLNPGTTQFETSHPYRDLWRDIKRILRGSKPMVIVHLPVAKLPGAKPKKKAKRK